MVEDDPMFLANVGAPGLLFATALVTLLGAVYINRFALISAF
ncbi:hypothetical protein ACXN5S_08995 [Pseudoroseicyclus sp. H15]